MGANGRFNKYDGNLINDNSSDIYDSKNTSISINASVGFFFSERLAIGVRPSFSSFRSKGYLNGVSTGFGGENNKLLFGPFCRYYFLKAEKNYNILTDISYSLGTNRRATVNEKGPLTEFNFAIGPEFFFNTSVGLEVLLGYKATKEVINSPTGYTDKRKGVYVGVGLQFHLEK